MYRALEVAKWFLQYNALEQHVSGEDVEGISNMKLQKLLYYAQGAYLAMYDGPLFSDDIVAWQHGPVVVEVYEKYKVFRANSIVENDQDLIEVDAKTQEVLEWVYNEFGQYTAWALRNMTHKEAPWRETPMNGVISVDSIKKYFKENYVEA